MAAQVSVFSKAVERSCKGEILENSHTFKIMALTSSYTPALDTDDVKADIVANEATGTNWSAGGQTLGSVTLTRTVANSWPTARANSTAYALGDIVRPASGNGHLYRCVAAGTSHSSIPTYPTTPGKTVVETGGVEWAECGTAGIVFDAADVSVATVTLTARYFVIYDDTHASDALFLLYDPGTSVAPVAGTLTIPWPTNGIFVRTTN